MDGGTDMATQPPVVMDDLVARVRRKLNQKTAPVTVAVERGAMIRYARDCGETNPIFLDEAYARTTRLGGLIASPTFVAWFLKGIVPDLVFDFDLPLKTVLHTDDVVESGDHIRPGDSITAVGELTDVFVREGRNGPMLFETADVTLTNQHGRFVGMVRTISVLF